MAPIVAGVLAERGNSSLVFRGDDGLDELTTTATSRVWVVRDGTVREEAFDPRDVGIELVPVEALRGADASYNADVARRLLDGETGPVRDAVLLNSAAALVALDPGDGLPGRADRRRDGEGRASPSTPGRRRATLERWVGGQQRVSRRAAVPGERAVPRSGHAPLRAPITSVWQDAVPGHE